MHNARVNRMRKPIHFAGCSSRKTVLRSPEEYETSVRSVSVPVFTMLCLTMAGMRMVIPAFKRDGAAIVAVQTLAGDHIEHLFAVGVVMHRVVLPGQNRGEAHGLRGARHQLFVAHH